MPIVLLAAACSGSTGSAGVTPQPDSPTSTSLSVSSASTSQSVADREAADRLAAEQAWVKYWQVHRGLLDLSAARRAAAVGGVAVDPVRQQTLNEAETFEKSGLAFYGQVLNRPYWPSPIGGKSVAVMGDCMDSSRYGTLVVKTNTKRTVGVAKNNTRVTLVRGSDGAWRVKTIEYLVDTPC